MNQVTRCILIAALVAIAPSVGGSAIADDGAHALKAPADGGGLDAAKLLKVQAAFVLNFIKFTTWPRDEFAADSAPLVVTIIGDDSADDADVVSVFTATLHDRKAGDHPVIVRHSPSIVSSENPDRRAKIVRDLADAHVVFLDTRNGLTDDEIAALNKSNVLTVGANPDYARHDAMLAFGIEQGKVVFFYNADAAHQSQLVLSSKLLSLARQGK